jgi:hypothetical protein
MIVLAALALAIAPPPEGGGRLIVGGWRLHRHLPDVDPSLCVARTAGDEAHMDVMINNVGDPIIILARPDWDLEGPLEVGLGIDREPARKIRGESVGTLVLVELSDRALVARLRRARTLTWALPFGRFRANIAGFGAGVDAVRACNLGDDTAAAVRKPI